MIGVYRVNILSAGKGRPTSCSWVYSRFEVLALLKAVLELRRHRKHLTDKPVVQFTVTREFA